MSAGQGSGRAVTLRGIGKSWGATQALRDVSIDIPAGSFTALLGPSGCGKSTLLRVISGLEEASAGQVLIDAQDVTAHPAGKRDLSMVFQSYALFPHLSVAENIIFGLRTRKMPRAQRQERLMQVADLLGLGALLERKPAALSGGQQQRVALGRAVVGQRSICLMDEPLSNLDAKLRQTMRSELRALQRALGFTMIYVTHDQIEAITMADQVVLMNEGRVEQVDTPRSLYQEPASTFAARFIGTPPMNIVPAADFGPLGAALEAAAGRVLLLGVRPESLHLAPRSPVQAMLESAEYLGADFLLHCRIGGSELVLRRTGATDVQPGTYLPLGLNADDLHLFDVSTGQRCLLPDLAALLARAGVSGPLPGADAPTITQKDL